MSIVLAEYSAIAAFADVVGALTQARALLDLIGMTSDFLADEVRHVELASRVVMKLGGAPPRAFDTTKLSPATPSAQNAFQRSNELALHIGCIAEVFAGGTAKPITLATTHPLLRSLSESIVRDEARHCRFGSLYFEWAVDRLEHRCANWAWSCPSRSWKVCSLQVKPEPAAGTGYKCLRVDVLWRARRVLRAMVLARAAL
ncbi:MAG: ferritin-like domain-containing protein [Polyangiaceae bacterium]